MCLHNELYYYCDFMTLIIHTSMMELCNIQGVSLFILINVRILFLLLFLYYANISIDKTNTICRCIKQMRQVIISKYSTG